MKIKRILPFLLLIMLALFTQAPISHASEFNFAVTPTIPENQIDKSKTYYDLAMTPGQQQTLETVLRNDTDKEVKVAMSTASATTNINGVVEYGKNAIKADKSLKYNLANYTELPKEVLLKPHTESIVKIKVTMPNETFDGVMAGGITFKEVKDTAQTDSSSDEKGLAIKNEYSFVVALLMRQSEKTVPANLVLNTIKPDQINARNVILSDLQNDRMTYINQVAVDAEITQKGDKQVLYSEHKDGLQIAPNSTFSLPVSLKGDPLKPGDYHIKIIAYGNKNTDGQFTRGKDVHYKDRWILEKDFTIDGTKAKELNKKDVSIKKDNTWIFVLIGILLLLLVLFILWFIWRKKKKDEEEQKEE